MFVRGQNIILRRTLSAIITLAFSISNLEIPTVEAEISASTGRLGSSIIQEIKIPTKWGDIVSRFEGDSKQLIIQIQDAHCNFEAQSNTARILEELFKKYGKELKVVNVEGSSGVLDTSALTLFPDREIKKQLALYYLKKGKISGAEYLSIIKEVPLELQGVEDLGLYFQNLKWFDRSLELREKADELIKGIQKVLNELQEPVFNDELKQFLRSEEAYEKGKTNLVEHLTLLKRMGEKKNVKTKDLKNVNLFLKVEEESQAIKFEEE
jgi:hypothetical protein